MLFRWKRVLGAVVVMLAVFMAGSAIAVPVIHHYKVQAAHGYWCVRSFPNGTQQALYGEVACSKSPEIAAQ